MERDTDENRWEPTIDVERQEKARGYGRARRFVFFLELGVGGVYAAAFLFTGLSVQLRDLAASFSEIRAVAVAIYFAIFYLGYVVVTSPLAALGGYFWPKRYGLSTQTFPGWMVDWFKALGISGIIGLFGVELAYYLLEVLPSVWWLVMGVVVLLFTVVLTNLAPLILVPLFYRMTPLEDDSLARRLLDLAGKANARVRGVYRLNLSAKTRAANAALVGLGNTRRIVLGDTLLDHYTDGEVEAIFAHELGHHVHGDIPNSILVQSVLTLAGLFIAGQILDGLSILLGLGSPSDIATMPLLTLTLGAASLLTMPVSNGFSRWLEREADRYALEATGNAAAFKTAMIKLTNQNLAELDPGWLIEFLLYDHPSTGRRIAFAEDYEGKG